MHTAQFSAYDIAQAIAQSQAQTVAYQGKAARKEQREYTVRATMGKGRAQTQIIEHYIAYDSDEAIHKFKQDYDDIPKGAQISAHKTKLSKQ